MYCTEKNSRIEDASRTVGGGSCGTEFPFRTTGACFLHRVPLKTRRVP